MTLFWIIVVPIAVVLAAITIVDIVRRHYGGWPTAAWVLLVVFLPLIGSLAYWIARKPAPADAERAHLAEAEQRHHLQRLPTDRSGF